jgi:hypothetical protein
MDWILFELVGSTTAQYRTTRDLKRIEYLSPETGKWTPTKSLTVRELARKAVKAQQA